MLIWRFREPTVVAGASSPDSSNAVGGGADAEDCDEGEDGAGDARPMRCAAAVPSPAILALRQWYFRA